MPDAPAPPGRPPAAPPPSAPAGGLPGMDISQLQNRIKKIAARHPLWAAGAAIKLAGPQATAFLPGILADIARFEAEIETQEREKAAAEERKREEGRRREAPSAPAPSAPGAPAPSEHAGADSKLWRFSKSVFHNTYDLLLKPLIPPGVGDKVLRIFLISGILAAVYVVLSKLGLRTLYNIPISGLLVVAVVLSVYQIAPGPITTFTRNLLLIFGGIGGFFALSMIPSPIIYVFATAFLAAYVGSVWLIAGRKKGAIILLVNLVFFGLLFTGVYIGMVEPGSRLHNAVIGQQQVFNDIGDFFVGFWETLWSGGRKAYFKLTGPYELAVEENSQQPLGVYLEQVGTTSQFVTMEDTVNVFAELRSRAFKTDKELVINVDCYEEGKYELKDKHGAITPRSNFTVAEDEQAPIDCNIAAFNLGPGSHTVTLEATFDFQTSSYLRGYFMEQAQIRSYKRQHPEEGANPLEAFGIADRNPIAVYTGGPLYVGMGVGQQPIAITNETYGPTLTITIDRNWPEGDLIKVNSLNIAVPPGLKISKVSGWQVDKYCSGGGDKEYSCVLNNVEILKRLFPVDETPVRLRKNIRVETMIADRGVLMAKSPLSIRSFKLTMDYNYRIKKSQSVTIKEKLPT